MSSVTQGSPESFADRFERLAAQIGRVVLGQDRVVRDVLIALIAGGHVLMEGPPGIGKTLLGRSLAQVVGGQFRRIQFTPDLMPSDVTGGNVFNPKANVFEFRAGPVFTEILLADEINRAPAKTQSALLEAMSDRQVSVDGETRPLPALFFTVATQNPIESEGTYPLPEAQLDRFLMKILVEPPPEDVEIALLAAYAGGFDAARLEDSALAPIVDAAGVLALRDDARSVRVAPELMAYIARIVARTRSHAAVEWGASPRASIALMLASQVLAGAYGRDYVVPDDVKELAPAVLRHRFILHPDAELDGTTPDDVVRGLLDDVEVPGGVAA